ncbi:MAG: hypothetical protein V3T53_15425 [Phycisphaerales bacterium]
MNFNRKNYHRSFCALSACLIAIFGLNPSANAGVILRVDGTNGTCAGDGTGWGANAYKYLQDALDDAVATDEIWVAAGWYYVDQSCANEDGTADRAETFQLVKEVKLLGGFDGTEPNADDRDPVANVTILSGIVYHGDPDGVCGAVGALSCFQPHPGVPGCDNSTCCQLVCDPVDGDPFCCIVEWDQTCVEIALDICGEAFHVVTAGSEIDDREKTVIDGFTIRDGWANGSVQLDQHHGGGMFIEGEPSVVRCTFRQNTASKKGGGMTIKGLFKRPHIINSIFEENPGDPAQPGDQQVIPINGGGLASISQADPIFTNCLFVENTSGQAGGAIYNVAGACPPDPPPGAACGRITLINCTVANNTADLVNGGHKGGGLHFGGTTGRLDAENTIVWGNFPNANQIDGGGLTAFAVNYSDCEGGCPGPGFGGTGNIDLNPNFVNAPDDLRLSLGSDAIDVGNPLESVIPCDFFNLDNDLLDCTFMADEPTPDLDLFNRVLDGDLMGGPRVDMGSYEFVHPFSCPWDINGDGMVGAFDLLTLLANWGTCLDCGNCPADFDGNCTVGASDLLALLANWGPCPAMSQEPLSLQEELDDACLTQADWDEFVDVMTDPLSSEADKDRYKCWMVHYLDHCNKCTCTDRGECPDPDPYG